jgi:hypothetical protein
MHGSAESGRSAVHMVVFILSAPSKHTPACDKAPVTEACPLLDYCSEWLWASCLLFLGLAPIAWFLETIVAIFSLTSCLSLLIANIKREPGAFISHRTYSSSLMYLAFIKKLLNSLLFPLMFELGLLFLRSFGVLYHLQALSLMLSKWREDVSRVGFVLELWTVTWDYQGLPKSAESLAQDKQKARLHDTE